jgi:hypothetical protein
LGFVIIFCRTSWRLSGLSPTVTAERKPGKGLDRRTERVTPDLDACADGALIDGVDFLG